MPVLRNSGVVLQQPNGTAIRAQDGVDGGRIENCRVDLYALERGIVIAGSGDVINTIGFSLQASLPAFLLVWIFSSSSVSDVQAEQ